MKSLGRVQRMLEVVRDAFFVTVGLVFAVAVAYGFYLGLVWIGHILSLDWEALANKILIAAIGAFTAFLAAAAVQELKKTIEIRTCVKKVAVLGLAVARIVEDTKGSPNTDRDSSINCSVGAFLFSDDDIRNIIKHVPSEAALDLISIVLALKRISGSALKEKQEREGIEEAMSILKTFNASTLQQRLIEKLLFPPGDLLPLDYVQQKLT